MKKATYIFVIVLISLLSTLCFSYLPQEYQLLQKVKSKLLDYTRNQGPEKTYLHTDKDLYTSGETIWFKTYLVDGISHNSSTKSNVVYVELVNSQDSVVTQRKLFVDGVGAAGDIELGEHIQQGDYTLRAYTKYMLNNKEPVIFEKFIHISIEKGRKVINPGQLPATQYLQGVDEKMGVAVSARPTIKFFPEGGHLVKGLPNTMGLEVLDEKGKGLALNGYIKDSKGNIIEPFKSIAFGLGIVGFTPLADEKYYASVVFNKTEEKFPLPEGLSSGYLLSLKNRENHILLQLASTTENGLKGTLLIGHLRGDMIFKRIGNANDKASFATKIYTKELQDGVAQFTLFSPKGEPISERLIFIDNHENDVKITISSPTKIYGTREKVELNIVLTDGKGTPLKGEFSLGVVSKNGSMGALTNNMKRWLLLDSDLGGTVQNPYYFFADDAKQHNFLLDALMLTDSWRRFVWMDMLTRKAEGAADNSPEKGIMVTGKTTAFGNPNKAKKTVATLNLFHGPDLINLKQETNAQGIFNFGPFYFNDSIDATIEAYDSIPKWEYKRKQLSILLHEQAPKLPSKLGKIKPTDHQTIELNQEYPRDKYLKKITDFNYDPKKVTRLNEVVVKKKKRTREEILRNTNPRITSGPFTLTIYNDSIPGAEAMSALDLVQRFPRVQVTGVYPNQYVNIPSMSMNTLFASNGPLFLVDGVPTDRSFVQTMRANEVSYIDLVSGPEVAIFGSRGSNGVIAFYTNDLYDPNRQNTEVYPGIVNFKIPGFHKAREFYKPNYIKDNPEKPDYRTTLFWNPKIILNEEGKSLIHFFTGDMTGTYWIKVEGITEDGRPVSAFYDLVVVEPN